MTTFFISDLHLCEEARDSARLFFHFIDTLPSDTEALYILGDLFEAYIGDDDDEAFNVNVKNALRSLTKRDIRLYYTRGNRDFLYGDAFAGKTQGLLLEDETVIDLYGTPTLVLHGDQLCTDDKPYQQFRSLVRSSKWRGEFMMKSLAERRLMAQEMRRKSIESQKNNTDYITDINADALQSMLQTHRVNHVIHGHTHRPAVHPLSDGQRIVLGDWHDSAKIIRADQQGVRLLTLSIDGLSA